MTRSTGKHATKQVPCRDCGELMTVGIRTYLQPRCLECGVLAAVDAVHQMREKRGPIYDRWLQGCLGIKDDPPPPAPLTTPR